MNIKKIIAIAIAFALIIGCVRHMTATEIKVSGSEGGVEDYTPLANENSDFEYNVLEDGTLQLTKYKGTGGDVVIPDTIDGKTVKTICYFTFYISANADKITSITIPSGLTDIEDNPKIGMNTPSGWTFEKCTNLTDIIVSEENKIFSSLNGVLYNKEQTQLIRCPQGKKGSFIIPQCVTSISYRAFYGCAFITSITIPAGVTEIDFNFNGCNLLAEINVDKENTAYSSIDGVLYSKDQSTLILCPIAKKGNYIIPNNVVNIENYAFKNCLNLSNIDIPNSVVSIGREAFCNCAAISSISIPAKVTEIVYGTFAGCASLSSIELPNNLTQIDSWSFIGCESLNSVEIPDSVASIGWCAFKNCTSLTSIIIPNSVMSIDWGAFEDCTSLTSIVIPDSVTSIEYDSFMGCDSLTIYGIPDSYAETYAKENNINFNAIKSDSLKNKASGIEVYTGVSAPSNTVLNVEKISENAESVTYNITLTSGGKNVDLKGEKAVVKIPLPSDEKAYDYKVYRKESNGNYTDMQAVISNGFLVFFTDHFSEYTVSTEKLIPDITLGDINSDGKINTADARWVLQCASGKRTLNDSQKAAADVNKDGKINTADAKWLLQVASGKRQLG